MNYWRSIYEYYNCYYDFDFDTCLIYCEKYGVCEARYEPSHRLWFIFREAISIKEDEFLYFCELPKFD